MLEFLMRMSAKFEKITKEKSAGSGTLVPPFGIISNPRVLSDMGLAIVMKKTLKII